MIKEKQKTQLCKECSKDITKKSMYKDKGDNDWLCDKCYFSDLKKTKPVADTTDSTTK